MWWRNEGGVIGAAGRGAFSRPQAEVPIITQPRVGGRDYVLLDGHAFRNAMNVLIARARTPFAVLILRAQQRDSTLALGETIMRGLRGSSGDLVG